MKYVNGITLEITQKCNFNCQYCFSCSSPETKAELPLDSIINVVRQFETLENKLAYDSSKNKKLKNQLVITGGEFLLHKNWRDLVEYLTENNI